MASRAPWPPEELELLESLVGKPDWLTVMREKAPKRTINALKIRMAKLRVELGVGDGRRSENECCNYGDAWMGEAVLASQALLAATLRVGVWS